MKSKVLVFNLERQTADGRRDEPLLNDLGYTDDVMPKLARRHAQVVLLRGHPPGNGPMGSRHHVLVITRSACQPKGASYLCPFRLVWRGERMVGASYGKKSLVQPPLARAPTSLLSC